MEKSTINLSQLKKTLPHGARIEIAKRSNKSLTTVLRVINGGLRTLLFSKLFKPIWKKCKKPMPKLMLW
ncbi:hypothetical protein BH09BAC2_BH09BAC2_00470 [soil metagenome]